MYEVKIYNDNEEIVIHSPNVNDVKLESGVIKTEINAVDAFDLTMYMNNPGYGLMRPFKTLVEVKNMITGEYEFEGRVWKPSENMESSGLHSTSYICEGELGYLHDAQQRHLEFRGTPPDLLQTIISYYNSQVEDYKHFEVGEVTVTNSTNNLYVYLSGEDDTLKTIKEKLIDKLGGELQIRKVNGVRYLDYLERIGEDKDTEIKLSKNLISMSRDVDPTEIVTRLTPLGTRVESADETATDASEARLTIESVNSGLPYIDRQDLIDVFGIQGGSIVWDDITVESNLYNAGWDWMNNQKISLNQYKVTAVDLSIIGLDIDTFKKGNSYPTKNPVMAIDERLRIIGTSKDLNEPQNGSLTIGDKFKSLFEYENDARESAKVVQQLQSRVNGLSSKNATLSQSLTEAQGTITELKTALQYDDESGISAALSDLETQLETIQSDVDGISYELATPTTDGLMSAVDKTKLNGLQTYSLATESTDGLLSAADKTKLNTLESYSVATETEDGLMAAVDKTNLNKVITDVGDKTLLTTTEKTDLVLAINELADKIAALEGGTV